MIESLIKLDKWNRAFIYCDNFSIQWHPTFLELWRSRAPDEAYDNYLTIESQDVTLLVLALKKMFPLEVAAAMETIE